MTENRRRLVPKADVMDGFASLCTSKRKKKYSIECLLLGTMYTMIRYSHEDGS
jgi:hypothetical protein